MFCVFTYSNVGFMEGNWVVIRVQIGRVILLCDSLYIGFSFVFVTYSNIGFMEGNWVVMGVECGCLLNCVTVKSRYLVCFCYVQQCCVYGR